jgi:hypothetical protein
MRRAMPSKQLLEDYPLYRKIILPRALPVSLDKLPEVRINMSCAICKSKQTFAMTSKYWDGFAYKNHPAHGQVVRLRYLCIHCQAYRREFYVRISEDGASLAKVGQFPSWEIDGDPNVERLLGGHSQYFRRGLICESQGYGIGAFGYYRRIVEEVIDGLLDEVSELLADDDLAAYQTALAKTKLTNVTQEKIDIVKDLLPPILRPNGMNPLSALHSALSEGLHADSDETCLEFAAASREVPVFLVSQVSANRSASRSFTDNMKKLLTKKVAKSDA